eukprot:1182987-Prorocentrum_minimum.AAC.6
MFFSTDPNSAVARGSSFLSYRTGSTSVTFFFSVMLAAPLQSNLSSTTSTPSPPFPPSLSSLSLSLSLLSSLSKFKLARSILSTGSSLLILWSRFLFCSRRIRNLAPFGGWAGLPYFEWHARRQLKGLRMVQPTSPARVFWPQSQ